MVSICTFQEWDCCKSRSHVLVCVTVVRVVFETSLGLKITNQYLELNIFIVLVLFWWCGLGGGRDRLF